MTIDKMKKTCGKLIAQYSGESKPCPNTLPCPMSYHSGETEAVNSDRIDKAVEEYQEYWLSHQASMPSPDWLRSCLLSEHEATKKERGSPQQK